VLILSVRDDPDEKISALNAGADDYVTKPFDTRELLARLRAIMRRSDSAAEQPEFRVGSLTVDFVTRRVSIGNKEVHLTPTEYTLLRVLCRHAGKVVTQRQLLREGWGPGGESHGEYLRVHLANMRKKIERDGQKLIQNEPGIGYRMLQPEE
jgi:two-component system KDP operon response regulator KdpE